MEEVDLHGEKLQERTAAFYKPDQSIFSEACYADEIKAELVDKRLGSTLEFKIDQIFSFDNAARATT